MPVTATTLDIDLTGRAEDLDRLRVVLLRLARRIRANSVGEITPSQFSMFVAILKHGPAPIGRIADIEHVKPPTASKIVANLEDRGLVERTAHPDDRRCSLIAASEAGRTYFEEVRAAGRTFLAGQLAALDADDVASLAGALPALERLLAGDA